MDDTSPAQTRRATLPEPIPPYRPYAPDGRTSGRLSFLLIVVCLLLGAAVSWGVAQYRERARLAVRNRDLGQAYTVVMAQRDDLAHFMSAPDTKTFRLTGRGPAAGAEVTIAWNARRLTGFVLGERVPLLGDDEVYRVWVRGADRKLTPTDRTFRPVAGLTCVEFHVIAAAPAAAGFVIAAEPVTTPGARGPAAMPASPVGPPVLESE
ncbi:MAG TPA: hypothetical protein VEA69_10645 [Tepidisphaeraceae bacterium]|nr:hypothetical protein [Tepidisphaeraceae bacterium]